MGAPGESHGTRASLITCGSILKGFAFEVREIRTEAELCENQAGKIW